MPPQRIQIFRLAYWAAVVAVFSWAAWLRMHAPLEPIADSDVWGYLSPAVNQLIGQGFTHSGRNFAYPGFLYLLLRVAGDFRVIAIAQHLLGLLAGALLLLTWQRARDVIAGPGLPAVVHRWLGLLPVGLYLFAADPIRFELQIRPEGICGFLGILNVYLALQFIYWFFVRQDKRASVVYGIGTILSVLVLGSVRPSFWLAALGSLLPVCFVFFRRGWSREKLAIALGAIAGLALLVLPERLLARGDDVDLAFVPMLLFSQHADIIRDQMAKDLADDSQLPYSRERIERVHSALSREIQKSFEANPWHYPSLGFDPEYLMFRNDSIHAELSREFRDDVGELCKFFRFYYGRTLLKQPGRMVAKIARQMSLFYGRRCGAYNWSRFLNLEKDYTFSANEVGAERFRSVFGAYQPSMDWVKRSEELASRPVRLEQRSFIKRPLSSLAKRYVPSLFAAILLSAMIWAREALRRRWGWLAGLVLFAYWHSFATCLETAALNSLEVYRYITIQFIFAILAQFLTILLVLEFLSAMIRFRRNIEAG
ncbi:MAG: hypothetical protein QOD12_1505 [Verrucomicrobiota bacterium]